MEIWNSTDSSDISRWKFFSFWKVLHENFTEIWCENYATCDSAEKIQLLIFMIRNKENGSRLRFHTSKQIIKMKILMFINFSGWGFNKFYIHWKKMGKRIEWENQREITFYTLVFRGILNWNLFDFLFKIAFISI